MVAVEAHNVQIPTGPTVPPSDAALGRLRGQADSQAEAEGGADVELVPTLDGFMTPVVRTEDLLAGFELEHRLHLWGSTAQGLASDREQRLKAISPNAYTSDRPFPPEQWGTDGNERYFDTVTFGYSLDGTGIPSVKFRGRWYPDPDSDVPTWAEVNLPGWVLAPGGIERYQAETDRLVAERQAEEDALDARISASIDAALDEMTPKPGRDDEVEN